MKFNKYFFENYSLDAPFDMNNPRYVLSQNGVDEILTKIIENKPYTLSIQDFKDKELVNAFIHIDVLQSKNNTLAMAIPFFIEKDAIVLKELSKKVASDITNVLLKHKNEIMHIIEKVKNGYSNERNLYHLLCGTIFDGMMFDYLEENELVTTSCVHESGLDYLVILYEDSKVLNQYSDQLLCSYNRLMNDEGKGFVSFGDSDGNRKDFYRFMRLKELNQLDEKEIITASPKEYIENFNRLIDNKKVDTKYLEAYEYFGYYKDGKIIVPIYDDHATLVANELYEYVLDLTKEYLKNALSMIQKEKRLLSITHHVEVKDIANEIYHLIFGEVNELLVKNGFVSTPTFIQNEGRYLKSFER